MSFQISTVSTRAFVSSSQSSVASSVPSLQPRASFEELPPHRHEYVSPLTTTSPTFSLLYSTLPPHRAPHEALLRVTEALACESLSSRLLTEPPCSNNSTASLIASTTSLRTFRFLARQLSCKSCQRLFIPTCSALSMPTATFNLISPFHHLQV